MRLIRCFNPCCCGSDSRTILTLRNPPVSRVFQSLLLWIGLTDNGWLNVAAFNSESFNPCCCGSDSRTVWKPSPSTNFEEFQSLLLWIGLTDSRRRHRQRQARRVSILVVVDRTHGLRSTTNPAFSRQVRFQSLLLWIGLTDASSNAAA